MVCLLTRIDSATWHDAAMSSIVSSRSLSCGLLLAFKSSLNTLSPKHTLTWS